MSLNTFLSSLQSGKRICWRAGERTKGVLIFTLHPIINRKTALGDHLKYCPTSDRWALIHV